MSKNTFTLISNDLGGTFGKEQVMNSFGCQGGNVSPQLSWTNAPEGTKSFVISMHDPDAPTPSGFWHWMVYDIPTNVNELAAGAGSIEKDKLPKGAFMGRVDTGLAEYGGPCPPEGDFPHRYIITIYALDCEKLGVEENTPLAQATFKMMTGHLLGRASIISYLGR